MVAIISKGVYNMKQKYVIISDNATIYIKASRTIKSTILDEFSEILHFNRQYLSFLLRNSGKVISKNGNTVLVADISLQELSKRGRKKFIENSVFEALKKIWPLTGFASSKHLVSFIRCNHDILFSYPQLNLSERTKSLLL